MAKIWEYVGNNNIHFLSIITLQVRYKDMENEVIVFKNGELELEVNVSDDRENVWLSKQQMAELFQRDRTVISKHLKNIFDEGELLENNTLILSIVQLPRISRQFKIKELSIDSSL